METATPLNWLLEEDPQNPSIRYFALRHLLDQPESDTAVQKARSAIMDSGPVPTILAAHQPFGGWVKENQRYTPKYRATVWSLLILAELGADPDNNQIRQGCQYLLDTTLDTNGAFSVFAKPTPRGAFYCINGNMLFALQQLGFAEAPQVQAAREWMARSIADKNSPTAENSFDCWVNEDQPCAWGANKAVRALITTPPAARTPVVERAQQVTADFLLSRDPLVADYPYSGRVSGTWFKLGFPLSYWSDVLETLANLVTLGYGQDARLQPGLAWITSKQNKDGRWKLENSLAGKMWVNIEAKGKPSKWITLRALRMLKGAGLYQPQGV